MENLEEMSESWVGMVSAVNRLNFMVHQIVMGDAKVVQRRGDLKARLESC